MWLEASSEEPRPLRIPSDASQDTPMGGMHVCDTRVCASCTMAWTAVSADACMTPALQRGDGFATVLAGAARRTLLPLGAECRHPADQSAAETKGWQGGAPVLLRPQSLYDSS